MIALNLIGTNKNSGTKTFNLNFFKQIDLSSIAKGYAPSYSSIKPAIYSTYRFILVWSF